MAHLSVGPGTWDALIRKELCWAETKDRPCLQGAWGHPPPPPACGIHRPGLPSRGCLHSLTVSCNPLAPHTGLSSTYYF